MLLTATLPVKQPIQSFLDFYFGHRIQADPIGNCCRRCGYFLKAEERRKTLLTCVRSVKNLAITYFRTCSTIIGRPGLTVVFGMGTSVSPDVKSPEKVLAAEHPKGLPTST